MGSNWKEYMQKMGPAWIVGALACGPGTLASVSKAGASFGYSLIWVVFLSAVFGATAQYFSAKLGITTRRGVIKLIEDEMGPVWAWILLLDAVAATGLGALAIMKALAGMTESITGVSDKTWAAAYGLFLPFLLVTGGYRNFERFCKTLVIFVVACFVVNLCIIRPSLVSILKGFIPSLPGGRGSALVAAGIMGGAVHINIIALHTYTVNSRGWTSSDIGLARFDTILSMFVAFGIYSMAIFLSAAAVLHPHGIEVKSPADVAFSLKELLGREAEWIFLAGLWGAAFSTMGPIILSIGYFVADKFGWRREASDRRFAVLLFVVGAFSILGPFIKGLFMHFLVVMLALGLTGTLLVLFLLLYLLNRKDICGALCNSLFGNILGVIMIIVSSILVVQFVLKNLLKGIL